MSDIKTPFRAIWYAPQALQHGLDAPVLWNMRQISRYVLRPWLIMHGLRLPTSTPNFHAVGTATLEGDQES